MARAWVGWMVLDGLGQYPSFAAYAEACGAQGLRVTDRGDLDDVLATAVAHPGPSLVEVAGEVALI